ncbi:MAG: DMT family transporter, partial [Rhodospirillales bacterium]
VQLAAALLLIAPLSLALETGDINWNGEFIFVLLWLAVVLSVGTFTLLYFLIRRGAASRVVSLFYLVPPMVAVESWILFGETITPTMLAGMTLTVFAVAIVTRG